MRKREKNVLRYQERCCVRMKVKQIITPFSYITQDGYVEINSVQFSHYCPKCSICIDYKMKSIYDLKYCFNCGQKLDISGIELTPKPIKPIRLKWTDIFSESESVKLCGRMFETIVSKDISKYL